MNFALANESPTKRTTHRVAVTLTLTVDADGIDLDAACCAAEKDVRWQCGVLFGKKAVSICESKEAWE